MQERTFQFTNDLGKPVHVYHWSSDHSSVPTKGILQIAHGMAETAQRYARLAETLTEKGWVIYANDHRGHGLTAGNTDELGRIGKDGFGGMIRDMLTLSDIIAAEHPSVPLFLMGHSMGSFLTQKVMYTAPERYAGFVLSGTNGPRSMLTFGEKLARMQCLIQGETHRSLMLNALVFGTYNKNFLPAHTAFDWLSRDEAEVQKYVDDPYCGFLCSAGFFQGLFSLLQEIHKPKRMRNIPKDKPIYIFGGDKDPVGMYGTGIRKLEAMYQLLMIKDIEVKLYPEGRHEMLNEINREEVTADLLSWLERHLPAT